MSSTMSRPYWADQAQRGQPEVLRLQYKITGAKTVTPQDKGHSLYTFDAISSQSVIDNYLGTTNEFLVAAFDATAMGNDMFGVIVNMGGQVQELLSLEAKCYSGSDGLTSVMSGVASSSSLTASTLKTECAKGAYGNMACKVNFGNTPDFDGLTSGLIVIELVYRVK